MIGMQLEDVRHDIGVKIGVVEDKVEFTRISLEDKIAFEVGDVKNEVMRVGDEVQTLTAIQRRVQSVVHGLEDKFYSMEKKLEDASDQLGNANKGKFNIRNRKG
jgi:hypothetical protein